MFEKVRISKEFKESDQIIVFLGDYFLSQFIVKCRGFLI